MISKRELTLFLALAFSLGYIFSDIVKPAFVQAETTNIVYDTLNAKILEQANRINALSGRVSSLESKVNSYDVKINTVANSVKKLSRIVDNTLDDFVTKKEFQQFQKQYTSR
jgi:hypothetical protein